jgi:hypothetical protein
VVVRKAQLPSAFLSVVSSPQSPVVESHEGKAVRQSWIARGDCFRHRRVQAPGEQAWPEDSDCLGLRLAMRQRPSLVLVPEANAAKLLTRRRSRLA